MLTERHRKFIKELECASARHGLTRVFTDAVHMMAQAMWSPLAPDRKAVEDDFAMTRERYTEEEYAHIANAFAELINHLQAERSEFLGEILEEIGASNTRNGQFLTPRAVAHLMGRVLAGGREHRSGVIERLHDPACGASILLIEQAEEMMQGNGVPQRDILVLAGDVDARACDISYVELSLLGYAAVVEQKDALSMKSYGETRYTAGYFIHEMPFRLMQERRATGAGGGKPDAESEKED